MIVPDGRTDLEKLRELLGNPEETHLDLKAKVDLDEQADRLKFVKDAVTMSNRPPGGYILIGVDDQGAPCMPVGTVVDRARFDGARIGDLVRGYIEGEMHLRVQIHDLDDGNEVVMVFVPHHRDGLPVPFSKIGQLQDLNGKPAVVFRPGEIFVREGAANVPIRHAHWPDILSAYAEKIRKDASDFAQKLIQQFLAARGETSGGDAGGVPLLMDMDDATFADAMVALLDADNSVRLRQFIRSFGRRSSASTSVEDYDKVLDKWVVFCAQALFFERADLVGEAIARLCDAYIKLGLDDQSMRKRLAVVVRIYALGSLAVRLEVWETITTLALRRVPSETYGTDYMYSSWIRHGQVMASRAGLTQDRFIISAARGLIANRPAMMPDLDAADVPAEDDVTRDDVLLNSLCEFDFAYCVVVFAKGSDHGEAYPSSAAFDEDRAKPMAQSIVSADGDVRRRLIPDSSDADIARALRETYRRALGDSSTRWWGPPPTVDAFIAEHDPQSP